MNNYVRVKLALAAIGVLLLIWGLRFDDDLVRWIAMGVLALSVLMRFLPRRLRGSSSPNAAP